ncbi:MAG: hypothetical protein AAGA81_19735 [Acidobacteriota bacterium]
MRNKILFFLLLSILSVPAQGQWKMLKRFIQSDVVIVEETKSVLILRHPEVTEMMVIGLKDGVDADIKADTAQARGGNPYRIWVASEKLLQDPSKPKQVWGRFFRSEFLRILKRPSGEATD